jgi:multisubunit Na+/H+ antiporter MnhB subunit
MPKSSAGVRALALAGSLTLFGMLAWAMVSLPQEANGLAPLVHERVDESGVSNPVTAVLLNFRGYDTLLEVAVLLLALIGASFLRAGEEEDAARLPRGGGPVLVSFARVTLPVMLVVAGYLLWAGSSMPGGAFQAAAVLAAAGLLAVLSGLAGAPRLYSRRWRAAVVSGFALFLTVAAILLVVEGALLQYPRTLSGVLILLIEAALAASLGLLLLAFFGEGRQRE